MNEQTTELRDYLRILSKYKYLIILGTWVCVIAAFVVTSRTVPVYESSVKLLVSQRSASAPGTVAPTAGESFQSIMVSERLAKTYSDILQGRMMAQKVIRAGRLNLSPGQLVGRISAEPIRDTQLIKVSVQDTKPAQAQRLANITGKVFSVVVEEIEGQDKVVPLVRVAQVESAILPTTPIKPKPSLNIALALIVGLITSAGLAFLLDSMDISLKTADDVERLLEVPVMGLIPKDKIISEARLINAHRPSSIMAEAFRSLRANVQYLNFDNSVKVLAVTSTVASEGKTTVAVNLAASLAQSGLRTLIIDCDLRHPSVHKYTETTGAVGLANVLAGSTAFEKAIVEAEIKNLFVLSTGPIPPNPAELLGSKHMQAVIALAREKADFVILDSPPALVVSDAAVMSPLVDGFLMVIKAGSTTRPAAVQTKATLERVGGKLLGTILNWVGKDQSGHGYYYSEEYYNELAQADKSQNGETKQGTAVSPEPETTDVNVRT